MNTNTILNIATGGVSLALIYLMVFGEMKDNKWFWGLLSVFFILVAIRARRKRLEDKR